MPAPYDADDTIEDLLVAIHPSTRIDDADAQAAIDELLSRIDTSDPDPANHQPFYHSHAVQDIYLGRIQTKNDLDNWPDSLSA